MYFETRKLWVDILRKHPGNVTSSLTRPLLWRQGSLAVLDIALEWYRRNRLNATTFAHGSRGVHPSPNASLTDPKSTLETNEHHHQSSSHSLIRSSLFSIAILHNRSRLWGLLLSILSLLTLSPPPDRLIHIVEVHHHRQPPHVVIGLMY